MTNISLEATLGVEPGELWGSISDFGGVSGLLDVVEKSDLVPGTEHQRVCVLANGDTLNETLVDRDVANRKLTYSITAGLPVTDHESSMEVIDVGNSTSRFVWVTDYNATDAAPEGFGELFEGMLAAEVGKLELRWP